MLGAHREGCVTSAQPLGGARFDNEGLFCIDSSATPSSLGANPSLTISAVSERAAEGIVKRGPDLGLPKPPHGFKGGKAPPVQVGDRVVPKLDRPKRRR